MTEYIRPLPGDVLFYKSNSIKGRAIRGWQKLFRLRNPEFMHVALMVDFRQLVEATSRGVNYVDIANSANVHKEAIILRNPTTIDTDDILHRLYKSSYKHYSQKYNWIGPIFRSLTSDSKEICSNLVKNVLINSEILDNSYLAQYPSQIYPADFYNALVAAGFERIGSYHLESLKETKYPLTNIPDFFERLDGINRASTNLMQLTKFTSLTLELKIKNNTELGSTLAAFSQFSSAKVLNTSIIDDLTQQLSFIRRKIKNYSDQVTATPSNWNNKDEEKAKTEELKITLLKNIELMTIILNQYCEIYFLDFLGFSDLNHATNKEALLYKNSEILFLTDALSNKKSSAAIKKFSKCVKKQESLKIKDWDVSDMFNKMLIPLKKLSHWLVLIDDEINNFEYKKIVEKHAIELTENQKKIALSTFDFSKHELDQ